MKRRKQQHLANTDKFGNKRLLSFIPEFKPMVVAFFIFIVQVDIFRSAMVKGCGFELSRLRIIVV